MATPTDPAPGWYHVLDMAAVVQLHRRKIAEAVADKKTDIQIFSGPRLSQQIMDYSRDWRSVLSIRHHSSGQQLRETMAGNRERLAAGLTMTSLFDWDSSDTGARLILAQQPDTCYRYSRVPLEMKIIDEAVVLLQGPFIDGSQPTVMVVTSAPVLKAAFGYWDAAHAISWPVREPDTEPVTGYESFTCRQGRILTLMEQGHTDESIAGVLGLSVRTIRYEIADILDQLGVPTRYAAGLKLGQLGGHVVPG